MDQLIPGLAALVEAFCDVFHPQAFSTFQTLIAPRRPKQRGASRKKGDRRPNPRAMIEDATTYPAELLTIDFPKGARELRVQVMVVLVSDPLSQWRDEALVSTGATVSAGFVILGYRRGWSVEPGFFDSKQFLGLHDSRAHPMAWFVGSLTILWYCVKGHEGSHVERGRSWYEDRVMPTFTNMLGALRLQIWELKVYGESGEELPSPKCIRKLLHKRSAVA